MDEREHRFLSASAIALFEAAPAVSRHIAQGLDQRTYGTSFEGRHAFCQACFTLQIPGRSFKRSKAGTLCLVCHRKRKTQISRKPGRTAMLSQQKSVMLQRARDLAIEITDDEQEISTAELMPKIPQTNQNAKSKDRKKVRNKGLSALIAKQKQSTQVETLDLSDFML